MPVLIPIIFETRRYQKNIAATINEVPCPLKKAHPLESISSDYFLHTELSSPTSKLDSPILQRFPTLRTAKADRVPQLWFNEHWAEEFASFVETIVGENRPPLAIEIHPPYKSYCTLEKFCGIYRLFEDRISFIWPKTEIVIENRFTKFGRNDFLISSYQDIDGLVNYLDETGLDLGIVLDLPQLIEQIIKKEMDQKARQIGEEKPDTVVTIAQLKAMFNSLISSRRRIKGIHLWGPERLENGEFFGMHKGDLNTLFGGHIPVKQFFLKELYEFLNDGVPRYFVPEVEGNSHVASIVDDLISADFSFQESPNQIGGLSKP